MDKMNSFYNAKVRYLMVQESPKEGKKPKMKTQTEEYLVKAYSIGQAEERLKDFVSPLYDEYSIIEIKQSKIVAVIQKIS